MDITNSFYIIKGDVNLDGKIDIDDFILVDEHIKGIIQLTGDSLTAADIDGDGAITIQDLSLIRDHIAGIRNIKGLILKGTL